MGVKCPFCQAENDDGVIFCFRCGKEFGLEKVITESELALEKTGKYYYNGDKWVFKCSFCQSENEAKAISCCQCGAEISKDIIKSTYSTFPKTSLKDIMKFTLKKMVTITIMMFLMILVAMMITDLLRK